MINRFLRWYNTEKIYPTNIIVPCNLECNQHTLEEACTEIRNGGTLLRPLVMRKELTDKCAPQVPDSIQRKYAMLESLATSLSGADVEYMLLMGRHVALAYTQAEIKIPCYIVEPPKRNLDKKPEEHIIDEYMTRFISAAMEHQMIVTVEQLGCLIGEKDYKEKHPTDEIKQPGV